MRLEADEQEVKSIGGIICTIFLLALIGNYAYLKLDVLLENKDVDVLSVVYDKYFDYNYNFTAVNGFNIAVAFTAYDNETDWILDYSYGELVVNSYSWGPTTNGSFETKRVRL